MEFDFEGEEIMEVMKTIALRLEVLGKQPMTKGTHAAMHRLGRFADRMGPVIEAGMRHAQERHRLN